MYCGLSHDGWNLCFVLWSSQPPQRPFNMGVACLRGSSLEQMHGLGLVALACSLVVPLWTGLAWDQVQCWLKGLYWSWRPQREGHIPAREASLHSVQPKFYFLRVIKALWNVIWLHFLSPFTFLLLQCTIVSFFWLFDCLGAKCTKKKIPFGANGCALTSSRELPQYTLLFKNVFFLNEKK